MKSTKEPLAKQVPRQPRNYPATKEEAAAMMRASAIPYRAETIGETLTRMIDRPPEPLPDEFLRRFAATAAAQPVPLGRIVRHALTESRRVGNV